MSKNPVFDFLAIGGQRCGTTWLHFLLDQHPDIFVPAVKEVHYFNFEPNYDRGPAWYAQVLTPDAGQSVRGECTPNYFWNTLLPGVAKVPRQIIDIAPKVHALNPDAKLLLILRDPVKRAISAWHHHIQMGRLRARDGFTDAWPRYGVKSMGMYSEHLDHWFASFPRENFLILNFERDVLGDPTATGRRVFEFLGVDAGYQVDAERPRNANGSFLAMQAANWIPAQSVPGRLIRKAATRLVPKSIDKRFRPSPTAAELSELSAFYAPYNAKLDALLEEDFSQYWS